MPTTYSRNW